MPKLDAKVKALYGPLSDHKVRKIYDVLSEAIVPRSDLHYSTAFELLVAVTLSAQSTDKGVNQATERLFPVANTPEGIVELGVNGLKPFIKTLGLYNNKAKNVVALSQQLLDQHEGKVPEDRKSLEALPGVGRKTANVVLNIAFGQPTIAVDTHIHRVANRTGIAETKKPLDTEKVLLARTPKKHMLHAHHYLILHGRYCCKARKPNCGECPVVKQCAFEDKT